MITTIGLGIKFLIKPIEEGHDAESGLEHISKKKSHKQCYLDVV